jgi:hypothetical protein
MILRMRFQRPQHDAAGFDLHGVAIERARRGAAQNGSVNGKFRGVAGADERLVVRLPVIGAAEVRALRRERDHVVFVLAHQPCGRFLAGGLTAVDTLALEGNFGRRLRRNGADIGRVDPIRPPAHGRRE